jgi:phosphoribosylglycinamide formyltransferase-1
MRNVVVLISGRGSNLQALITAASADDWEHTLDARIAAVVSNRADAQGLAIARQHGLPAHLVAHGAHADRPSFEGELGRVIDAYDPALVVLAGFMRVLTAGFVDRYAGRMINVHPSLLPAFPGLATHRQALAAGVRIHGATVHFVASAVDAGPIVAQAALGVRPEETEESLAARVLALEHVLLPQCVALLLSGGIRFDRGRVVAGGDAADRLSMLAS